jgi:restriction system protein
MPPKFHPPCVNQMRLLKGWVGEKKSAFRMWLFLDKQTYRRFHNVIVPTSNGTTQIDHILVSPFGLFIVETKNMKGWIFGSENQAKWTQSLYGQNYSFQNPLRQAYRQKKSICEFLEINESVIHTIIYFVGDCEFKTSLPANVIRSRLGRCIKRFKSHVLTAEEVNRVVRKLERHLVESNLTTRDHVRSLRQRHSSTTVCPKCGSNLVERTAKQGRTVGSTFLGCENYPRCRFTRDT